jgi:hypothetical protein
LKQKEGRDLENALAWDGKPGNIEAVLEAMRIDKEESEQFFKEAGQITVRGMSVLLDHRYKRVNNGLVKHWFIYDDPDKKEVRLLAVEQRITGNEYTFRNGENSPIFSYA